MSRTKRRGRCREVVEGSDGFVERGERPERVTVEWAVRRMEAHIGYEAERLVLEGVVTLSDREDVESMLREAVIRAAPKYDSGRRGDSGRTSSPVHFLTVVVDNAVLKIRRFRSRLCRDAVEVPIACMCAEDAARLGFFPGARQSDGCRRLSELEFKLDVETLRGTMKALELVAFDLLAGEWTYSEIADRFGISESWFRRGVLKGIRRKARACGFAPRAEKPRECWPNPRAGGI